LLKAIELTNKKQKGAEIQYDDVDDILDAWQAGTLTKRQAIAAGKKISDDAKMEVEMGNADYEEEMNDD